MNEISTTTDVVNRLVDAVNEHDAAALALLFNEDAVVIDDGHEHADAARREKWILERNITPKLDFIDPTITVDPQGNDQERQTARLVTSVIGDFPGGPRGPLRLAFQLTLSDNLVERLEIALAADGE